MSTNRLMVVGTSAGFDATAAKVMGGTTTRVVRCASPTELVTVVSNARTTHFKDDEIDVLDLHDHHVNHGIMMGSAVLFDVQQGALVGGDVAAALAAHLRETAQIRLLGCDIVFESGESRRTPPARHLDRRYLLRALADRFGGARIVSGTNCIIDINSFSSRGFAKYLHEEGTFSSLAAVHTNPVGYEAQRRRLALLRAHAQS